VELNRLVTRFGKYLNLSKEKRKLFSKLDQAMKDKADAQAKENSCCSGDDGKGDKCC